MALDRHDFAGELIGSFLLVFFGCGSLAVTLIISVVGPLTQAGLNPARDLSPRFFAFFAGWGEAALADGWQGSLVVYCLEPVAGGGLASLLFTSVVEPLMKTKKNSINCKCD
ncbi:MAG: aquaporin [Thermodesulfovibrionales bacterium]|jgi:glycerol uptake facilitator protein